jgi:hypothetical protein
MLDIRHLRYFVSVVEACRKQPELFRFRSLRSASRFPRWSISWAFRCCYEAPLASGRRTPV